MKNPFPLFLLSATALLSGCVTQEVAPDPSILRVGVSPNSQPMVFKQNGKIAGIEAEFAQKVGEALGRKIVFVEVPWDKQIDYLNQGRTDVIMSGMTITEARSILVDFTTPYMQSGLTPIFRRDSYDPSGMLASIVRNQNKPVGYVKDTTSEQFVFQHFMNAKKIGYAKASSGIDALKRGRLGLFINDAPMIWWQFANNESELVAFPDVLNIEPLAWAVRKGDSKLLNQLNALIAKWDKDGTSQKIVQHWIPFFRRSGN